MTLLPPGVKVHLALGFIDMRKGIDGLAMLVQEVGDSDSGITAATVGFTNPVLIDNDGVMLAGHGRYEAARLLGLPEVPTIRIADLREAQKPAYVLAERQ